jgi:hypothetical protein
MSWCIHHRPPYSPGAHYSQAKDPQPVIVDDEFVDQGNHKPCAYRFEYR